MVLSNLLASVAPNSLLSHTFFPPPSKFDPARDIPDLSAKVRFPLNNPYSQLEMICLCL